MISREMIYAPLARCNLCLVKAQKIFIDEVRFTVCKSVFENNSIFGYKILYSQKGGHYVMIYRKLRGRAEIAHFN